MNDELVSVMVPRRHLALVYGFLSKLDNSENTTTEPVGVSHEESSVNRDEWTPSRLKTMVSQSQRAMCDILRTLADHPGKWLTMDELAKAIRHKPDADWNTVAGTLGAFGRRVKNRYKLETWPFENRYDHEVGGRVCMMSPDISRLVKQYLPKANN